MPARTATPESAFPIARERSAAYALRPLAPGQGGAFALSAIERAELVKRGLPARAVRTACMQGYLKVESTLKAAAHAKARCAKKFDCLVQCGLRDGLADWGQFCIDNQLVAALRGDLKKGLFFRGAGNLPFGDAIRPVRELLERLLTPAATATC